MVAIYDSIEAVISAIKAAQTPQQLHKIALDLEQRNAPSRWIRAAYNAYFAAV